MDACGAGPGRIAAPGDCRALSTLTLTRPDDWHVHLRDGAALRSVAGFTAARFARAVVMPNLRPPVTTVAQALAYRERVLAALPPGSAFEPLMSLYLTDRTDPGEVDRAHESGAVCGFKFYPAGATTNAEAGVTRLERVHPVLERMERRGVVLQVHGEVTDPEVDVFDREAVFIERQLAALVARFPGLRIVLEHVTTEAGVRFVQAQGPQVAATLTPQHLLLNRNDMLAGRIRPHLYCLPVLKRERDRAALLAAATGGDPRFFLGTDSAPHARSAKESDCGCAGVFSAHAALELYAEIFDRSGALVRLEGFASHFGADFYGLPRNRETVTLRREAWRVPAAYAFGDGEVVPLRAGGEVAWRLVTGGEA